MSRVVLDLSADEAMCVMGALNMSSVLRSTVAPVTLEQLEQGRIERDLCTRVLIAIAATEGKSCPVTSHAKDCRCFGEGGDR